jgi:hypothetical protein
LVSISPVAAAGRPIKGGPVPTKNNTAVLSQNTCRATNGTQVAISVLFAGGGDQLQRYRTGQRYTRAPMCDDVSCIALLQHIRVKHSSERVEQDANGASDLGSGDSTLAVCACVGGTRYYTVFQYTSWVVSMKSSPNTELMLECLGWLHANLPSPAPAGAASLPSPPAGEVGYGMQQSLGLPG